jgi:hypothetical protein
MCVACAAIVIAVAWKASSESTAAVPSLEFDVTLLEKPESDSVVSAEWASISGIDFMFVNVEKLDSSSAAQFSLYLEIRIKSEDGAKKSARGVSQTFEWRDRKLWLREMDTEDVRYDLTFAFKRLDDRTYAIYAIYLDDAGSVGMCGRRIVCVRDVVAGRGAIK